MRRTRALVINQQMLERMLDLPEGGKVLHVGTSNDPESIFIVVEHPSFDEVPDYCESPRAMAEVKVEQLADREPGQVKPIRLFYRWELGWKQ